MATEIKHTCDGCGRIATTMAAEYLKKDGRTLPQGWHHAEIKVAIGFEDQEIHTHLCDLCAACAARLPMVCFPGGWPKVALPDVAERGR